MNGTSNDSGDKDGCGESMTDEASRDLWKKLSELEKSFVAVSTSVSGFKITLEHIDEDFDRIEKLLGQLEVLLYGKGQQPGISLITRIIELEKSEERRQRGLLWVWAAIIGLIFDGLRKLFGFGN